MRFLKMPKSLVLGRRFLMLKSFNSSLVSAKKIVLGPGDHLQKSSLSYFGHLFYAMRFSLKLLWASIYVLWHGVYPSMHSHWRGRALIIEAFSDLPWDVDKDEAGLDVVRRSGLIDKDEVTQAAQEQV
jgi:hypothetical protein